MMSDLDYNLMLAMEFEIPSLSPCSLSETGMREDSKGIFTYRQYALTLKDRVKQLEQQLSDIKENYIEEVNRAALLENGLLNSIGKDDLRGLVEEYNKDSEHVSEQEHALLDLIEGLNELLEGTQVKPDSEGEGDNNERD